MSASTFVPSDDSYNEYLVMQLTGLETLAEINQKYADFSRQLNPETGRNPDAEKFKAIRDAYKLIKTSDISDLNTKDEYAAFGVGKDAFDNEITKAFKKLSLKHHPDKAGKTPGEKFRLTQPSTHSS